MALTKINNNTLSSTGTTTWKDAVAKVKLDNPKN